MNVVWPGAPIGTIARFYLRPVRKALTTRNRSVPRTWGVRLGPLEVAGRRLLLRSPRLSDGADWCAVRLAEQERIEPWWLSSPLPWQQRHTEAAWVSGWLESRRSARAGLALPLVVEVDGRLAGQCGLEQIDPFTGSGELGIWMDSRVGRGGFGVLATALVLDHAFGVLEMNRITAPICVGNAAPRNGCRRLGMVREGTMASFLHVGGQWRDHDLWAITADRIPAGGLVRQLAERRVIDIRLNGRET